MTAWVGLTGGIGSGKSQAAAEFVRLGVPHIDADVISRNLTAAGGQALPAIRKAFGGGVFDAQGLLDRAALRDFVFRRPQSKEILEGLMFPLILDEIRCRQGRCPQAVYGVVDVPLLIENPQFLALADRVLVIDVAEDVQIRRVRQRSGLDESEIRRIVRAQVSRRDRLLHADDVLVNEGSVNELAEKVGRLHMFYSHTLKAGR